MLGLKNNLAYIFFFFKDKGRDNYKYKKFDDEDFKCSHRKESQ